MKTIYKKYINDSDAEWFKSLIYSYNIPINISHELTSDIEYAFINLGGWPDIDDIQLIEQYKNQFKKIIVLCAEITSQIKDILIKLDGKHTTFICTGSMNFKLSGEYLRFENFFNCLKLTYKNLQAIDPLKKLRPYEPKELYFDALLGRKKSHRDFIVNKLDNTKIHVEYMNLNSNMEGLSCSKVQDSVETVNYYGVDTWFSHIVPIEIYNQTAYSIVSETMFKKEFCFLTEKTAKPILAKRLFIMFAGPGYLDNIRKLGYQTFGDVIDESYDSEIDDARRWTMALEQVNILSNLDQRIILEKIKPVLEHNYNLFMTTDYSYEPILEKVLFRLFE